MLLEVRSVTVYKTEKGEYIKTPGGWHEYNGDSISDEPVELNKDDIIDSFGIPAGQVSVVLGLVDAKYPKKKKKK